MTLTPAVQAVITDALAGTEATVEVAPNGAVVARFAESVTFYVTAAQR